ncbi:hypothetical protein CPG37_08910 [Malaciobacter canalis]|uniref:Uncharacterized protein n=1 Tax=Malaciobacter canalis TaxID=1912871 RepID=A0ABX4LPV6_9BACT|nr:hypothetical protein [Malaciobacter canalis]PHO09610.1 hypothetical protein CPG37_08910 [Malaciobacter canalis]QEE31679.1 hypothetical protein ACAN_0143 [Malaciobacter canalis]
MKTIYEDSFFKKFVEDFKIKVPDNFLKLSPYHELKNFKSAEYIYCIAYEMLIRTDEYNNIMQEYALIKNKSKYEMTNDEFSKLRELLGRMNNLGLNKISFLGFDCGTDYDYVLKKIEYYDEIVNSSWSVRMVHKFEIEPSLGFNSIYHKIIDYYQKKGKLYVYNKVKYYLYDLNSEKNIMQLLFDLLKENENSIERIRSYINGDELISPIELDTTFDINKITTLDLHKILCFFYIPIKTNNGEKYVPLTDELFLKYLDEELLFSLKEKKSSDLLIKRKSEFSQYNSEFWNKYCVSDIKNGLMKLVDFHVSNNLIYNAKGMDVFDTSTNEILENPSNFYIPCVNRMEIPSSILWSQSNDEIPNNRFQEQLKYDGHNIIIAKEGLYKLKREDNIYLINIDKNISLSYLDDSFLETLVYEDLKNINIETEPLYSRPRLIFDEARLTSIPINLNLSKEDLLLYVSRVKEEYDRDKNIVKTDEEYFFDLTLDSDLLKMPSYIKSANEKRSTRDKRLLPVKRHDFVEKFASGFYIYDLYKFFLRYFKIKRKCIRRERRIEIKKIKAVAKREGTNINIDKVKNVKNNSSEKIKSYSNYNLINKISELIDDLTEEQVFYYLTTMKEFIHGVNQKGEWNNLKKKYNPKKEENPEPKYKNLIIGDSYIIKSNKTELIDNLGI